jgi:signal transduction histidine kinase
MLFERARRRLTIVYLILFAATIAIFSAIFFVAIAVALQPDFDVAPELSSEQVARLAYDAAVGRVGIALVVADLVVIAIVGLLAWVLAARTLRPIRQAHERQRRFVADASHEMRTPLTAIRTTSEVALLPDATAAEMRTALVQVGASSERLGRLAADLLLLAQSDDAELQPRREAFDLSVTVAEALATGAAAGPRRGAVELSLQPDVSAAGDPSEIARIVDNLVDNALRYGGPKVQVRVATRTSEREAILEVSDTGPGIPQGDQERIFQPFHRLRSDADAPPGTGLGLAIAASLARRNRGRLIVESDPGRGSIFRLVLPRFR